MKKLFAFILALALVLSFASCVMPNDNDSKTPSAESVNSSAADSSAGGSSVDDTSSTDASSTDDTSSDDTSSDDTSSIDDTSSETSESGRSASELAALLRKSLPKIDGSTSAIPLDAAIRASILGITPEEAEKSIVHTTSYDSFENLLKGNCRFIFSHLLSAEQEKAAEQYKKTLVQTPISREGFIFIVNKKNPVDNLTSAQVKDIYSGKITNWKEVGGEDEPIVAYQRDETSGSQNYMKEFMAGTKLIDAPVTLRPKTMDSLVDYVAAYDGGKASIGYSVFSYVEGMYNAEGGVKIISIDGVTPSFKTISDGSYPCTGYNYAIFNDKEAKDSPARLLLEYILTDECQKAIAATGYFAPLKPTSDIDVTIKRPVLYTSVGTGKESVKSSRCFYTGTVKSQIVNSLELPVTDNEALNADIKAFATECANKSDKSFETEWCCINGYLSLTLSDSYDIYTSVVNFGAVWDIYTGKRLSLSDAFTKDCSFVGGINTCVSIALSEVDENGLPPVETLRPFDGIESGFNNFALCNKEFGSGAFCLFFNQGDNSYFRRSVVFRFDMFTVKDCVFTELRDMQSVCENQTTEYWKILNIEKAEFIEEATIGSRSVRIRYTPDVISGIPAADIINAKQMEYLKQKYNEGSSLFTSESELEKALKALIERGSYGEDATIDDLTNWEAFLVSEACVINDKYVAVTYGCIFEADVFTNINSPYGRVSTLVFYDAETGDEVSTEKVIVNELKGGYWLCGIEECEKPENITSADGLYVNKSIWRKTDEGNYVIKNVHKLTFVSENNVLYTYVIDPSQLTLPWEF